MSNRGPWKVLSRELKYQNRFGLSVNHDSVVSPSGERTIYGWVEIKPGAYALPVDKDRNVWLVQQEHSYAINAPSLEVAGGGIDNGHTPEQTVREELEEELGIVAKRLTLIREAEPMTGVVSSRQYFYLATGLSFTETKLEPTESITPVRMSLEEAVERATNGQIIEALSSAAIFATYHYILKHPEVLV